MFTADHPQTDGQTELVNRFIGDVMHSVCAESPKTWSSMLPVIEFALKNAVHASTEFTLFYVNSLTRPRVPLTLTLRGYGLGGEEYAEKLAGIIPITMQKQVSEFLATRFNVLRHMRDAMTNSQDK